MRLLNLFIAFSIFIQTSSSFATTSNYYQIDSSMDKIRYEAEQGNINSQDKIQELVNANLNNLISQGISIKEITQYLLEQIKDAQKKRDFETLLIVMSKQNLPQNIILERIQGFFTDTNLEGASFASGPSNNNMLWIILGAFVFITTLTIICAAQGGGCEDLGIN